MKKLIFTLALLSTVYSISAQSMRSLFAEMPDSILVLLTKNNRLDCIDFIENKMSARVKNKLDQYSELQVLTPDYLKIQLSSKSYIQMKTFPLKDSLFVVCLVKTYLAPAAESSVAFYSKDWQKLSSAQFLTLPSFADFWIKNDTLSAQKLQMLQNKIDLKIVAAELSAATNNIVFSLQLDDLSKETQQEVVPYIRPVVYRWKDERFESK